ncbi:hypothetical protein SDC9_46562 [bioreactor metagenome]|uniref:Uncharacterized protein n=1 Tax=bioreactor metagenome TaxID=1076179 RepID=A0A644W9Z7_9ZZZZ
MFGRPGCFFLFGLRSDLSLAGRKGGKHDPHVPALHAGVPFALSEPVAVGNHTGEDFFALVEKGHLAAPEEHGNLDSVSVLKEALDRPDLEIIVVFIDFRAHFHFFEGLDFLFLSRVLLLFLELVAILPVVQYPAHRRVGLRGNLDKVELPFFCQPNSLHGGDYTHLDAVLVDKEHFTGRDFTVDSGISVFFSCYYSLSPPCEI